MKRVLTRKSSPVEIPVITFLLKNLFAYLLAYSDSNNRVYYSYFANSFIQLAFIVNQSVIASGYHVTRSDCFQNYTILQYEANCESIA